jgi:hypothetical protein
MLVRLIVFMLLAGVSTGSAQTIDSTRVDSAAVTEKTDTVLYAPVVRVTEANTVSNPVNYEQQLSQQPTIGLLKSAVIPGWGQLGNHRYIKAGVFAALQTWFVLSAVHYGSAAADYRSQWNDAVDPSNRNDYYGLYQDHRDDRNKFTWFAVINSFVAMFDAFVDAHLSGSPDRRAEHELSFDIVPHETDGARAVLSYSF